MICIRELGSPFPGYFFDQAREALYDDAIMAAVWKKIHWSKPFCFGIY